MTTKNFLKPLRVLLLMLVAAGTIAGCGDSREQFVFTGTAANPTNVGSLTFINLDQIGFPAGTTNLDFDFYAGTVASGNLVDQATAPFAGTVTVTQVPGNANVVVITAYDVDGAPVATTTAPVSVLAGGNRVVDVAGATVTPVTVTGVVVTPTTATVVVGGTQQFTATTTYSNGQSFTGGVVWTVENVSGANPNATVSNTGLATGTAVGVSDIVATRGTLLGAPSGRARLTVTAAPVNLNPTVNLNDGVLNYTINTAPVLAFDTATVTDDDANLAGGTLTIASVDGTGVDITVPAAPAIGTISNNGTPSVTVALNSNATPANIQAFLRLVTFSTDGTASFGNQTVTVTVTDSAARSGSDSRTVNVQGASAATINVPADFATLQLAVDDVAATADGQGSVIVVAAGDDTADGLVTISNNANLTGLNIRGANFGVSAGNEPGTRAAESRVSHFDIDNRVVIDGFQIEGNGTDSGILARGGASDSVFRNNRFTTDAVAPLFDAGRGIETVTGVTPSGLTITGNRFSGWATGTFLQGSVGAVPVRTTGHSITNNVFVNNNVHASNDAVENTSYLRNSFGVAVTDEAISFLQAGAGIVINGNDFLPSSELNFFDIAGQPANQNVNAQNNWWGQAAGALASQNNPNGGTGTFDTSNPQTSDPFPTQP